MEAKGKEAHRILRVILPPHVVGDILECLEGVVVARCVAVVHEEPGHPLWLEGTDVCRFHDGTERPFRRYRVLADKLPIPGHRAAEILGPWAVHGGSEQDPPNLLRPDFLRDRWQGEE